MTEAREMETLLQRYAGIDPPYPCWLGGDRADPGPDYCRECATERVKAGFGEFVDGGYDAAEAEHCCHCEGCGKLLDYFLTDYGVRDEMQHFHGRRLRSPLDREEAFHIARILEAAPNDKAVLRLGRRALKAASLASPSVTEQEKQK